ncbi:hypothetical protein NPS59_12615 [Pseudomonas putida]|uniref:Uncharacterized protein n=1 Tax=Pseudomonas putida (strain GB-1) TaxID=76869 RepID=B0KT13_PSEPG|nr:MULTISPECIES: hypothetical protein [Pseudomonas]ABY97131.1 conserved hypothetical protein [Pseudomonas putida GB-1]MCK2187137.1 hypothetical protein [Pseudomonas sp. MB04B]MDD2085612.1 hypothetical protein [Pseudomonas putida]MDD2095901.1 hypothetical protein [Pseudomonas putida]
MRIRGDTYWAWADPELHCRTHSEKLDSGFTIDVQVRLSRLGVTQLFIGLYGPKGLSLHEEAHTDRPSESMTTALIWGTARARDLASSVPTRIANHG